MQSVSQSEARVQRVREQSANRTQDPSSLGLLEDCKLSIGRAGLGKVSVDGQIKWWRDRVDRCSKTQKGGHHHRPIGLGGQTANHSVDQQRNFSVLSVDLSTVRRPHSDHLGTATLDNEEKCRNVIDGPADLMLELQRLEFRLVRAQERSNSVASVSSLDGDNDISKVEHATSAAVPVRK